MEIMNDIVLNLILVVFPILVYFIYNCYRELKCEKYNNILLDVSLFSSLYLCLRYGDSGDISKIILFSNIPILVAYLKEEVNVGIILSLIDVIYAKYILDYSVILMIIKFICYLVIYMISKRKNAKDNKFIITASAIQGFFLSFEYFNHISNYNILTILELFMVMVIFYIVPFALLYLFKLTDNITNLYQTVTELEKEKQVRNSLFQITHEVKNPIAVCKGYLEMLDPKNEEQTFRYVEVIKQEIDRSLNIMSDFMEFSKIKVNKDIIDINMLLDDISDCLKLLITSKNVEFIYYQNDDERYVEGDYNRLKQVFINLFKNSLESLEVDGRIELSSFEDGDYYEIEISDNGIGMDEETLSRIKDMFYTTKRRGTGLGVSLSNEIIKKHNGELRYESRKGEYTKVYVKLPKYVL